jgi:hypothetical protein
LGEYRLAAIHVVKKRTKTESVDTYLAYTANPCLPTTVMLGLEKQIADMVQNRFFVATIGAVPGRIYCRRSRRRKIRVIIPKHRKEESITAHDLANQIFSFDPDIRESEVASIFAMAR